MLLIYKQYLVMEFRLEKPHWKRGGFELASLVSVNSLAIH